MDNTEEGEIFELPEERPARIVDLGQSLRCVHKKVIRTEPLLNRHSPEQCRQSPEKRNRSPEKRYPRSHSVGPSHHRSESRPRYQYQDKRRDRRYHPTNTNDRSPSNKDMLERWERSLQNREDQHEQKKRAFEKMIQEYRELKNHVSKKADCIQELHSLASKMKSACDVFVKNN